LYKSFNRRDILRGYCCLLKRHLLAIPRLWSELFREVCEHGFAAWVIIYPLCEVTYDITNIEHLQVLYCTQSVASKSGLMRGLASSGVSLDFRTPVPIQLYLTPLFDSVFVVRKTSFLGEIAGSWGCSVVVSPLKCARSEWSCVVLFPRFTLLQWPEM